MFALIVAVNLHLCNNKTMKAATAEPAVASFWHSVVLEGQGGLTFTGSEGLKGTTYLHNFLSSGCVTWKSAKEVFHCLEQAGFLLLCGKWFFLHCLRRLQSCNQVKPLWCRKCPMCLSLPLHTPALATTYQFYSSFTQMIRSSKWVANSTAYRMWRNFLFFCYGNPQ